MINLKSKFLSSKSQGAAVTHSTVTYLRSAFKSTIQYFQALRPKVAQVIFRKASIENVGEGFEGTLEKDESFGTLVKEIAQTEKREVDCAFCAFIQTHAKEAQKVYEDEKVYAFLDDYPLAEGHTLIILKAHHSDLSSVSPADAARLGEIVARLSKALKQAVNAEYIYVASLGEQVRHVHYHLIPRYNGDRKGFVHFLSPKGRLKDANTLAARIREEVTLLD